MYQCAGETGKEYGVKVFEDTRSSEPYRPKPCVVGRETGGEASVGAYTGRVIKPRKF
jgi:hypothetical protein